jgi:hypothetical protein
MYTQAAARGTQAQGDRHALRTTADRAGRLFLGTTAPEPAPRRASHRGWHLPWACHPLPLNLRQIQATIRRLNQAAASRLNNST